MRLKILGIVAVAFAVMAGLSIFYTSRTGDTKNSTQSKISESYVRSAVVLIKQSLSTFDQMTPEKLAVLKSRREIWPDGWLAFKETSQGEALYLRDNDSLKGPNVQSFLQFISNVAPNLKDETEIHPWQDDAQKTYLVVFVQKEKQFLAVLMQNPLKGLSTIATTSADSDLKVVNEQKEIIFSPTPEYIGQKVGDDPVIAEIKSQGLEQSSGVFKNNGKSVWGRYQRVPNTGLFVVQSAPLEANTGGKQSIITFAIFGGLALMVLALLTIVLRSEERKRDQVEVDVGVESGNDRRVSAKPAFSTPAPLDPDGPAGGQINTSVSLPPLPTAKLQTPPLPPNFREHDGPSVEDKMETYKRMMASLSQEIRGPLFSVMGKLQLAQQDAKDDTTLRELNKAIEEIRGLKSNVDKLANFSGEKQEQKKDVSVDEPLKRALADLEKLFSTKRVSVAKAFKSQDVVSIEEEGFFLAFKNILENSVEAMDRMAEKRIIVETHREGGKVVVSISDNGEGMNSETRKKALEPFFTTRGYTNHMGLGLWQAFAIVNSHGGDLIIQTEQGVGTQVRISIPLTASQVKKPAKPIAEMLTQGPPPLLEKEEIKLEKLQPLMPPQDSEPTVENQKLMPTAPAEKDLDELLALPDDLEKTVVAPAASPRIKPGQEQVSEEYQPVSMVSPPRFHAPEVKKEIDSYQVKVRRPGEKSI